VEGLEEGFLHHAKEVLVFALLLGPASGVLPTST
jgi:hypothetical protein